MEKELKEIKEELAKLKTRVFDLENKMNKTMNSMKAVHILVKNAIKILEREEN